MLVGPGQRMSATDPAVRLEPLHRVINRVLRDVDASDLNARAALAKVMQQEAFTGADIENAHARLDAIGGDHGVGHLAPAAVVLVAAVAGLAAPVPIIVVEFDGELGDLGFVAPSDAGEVIARSRLVYEAYELSQGDGLS